MPSIKIKHFIIPTNKMFSLIFKVCNIYKATLAELHPKTLQIFNMSDY